MIDPTQTDAWHALQLHREEIYDLQMRDLFRDDPGRAERFSLTLASFLFDYSKNRITDDSITLLTRLAEEARRRTPSDHCRH